VTTKSVAEAARHALDHAIAALVTVEVARALEAAPEVEDALDAYANAGPGRYNIAATRQDAEEVRTAWQNALAAIAADKARAVKAARDGMYRVCARDRAAMEALAALDEVRADRPTRNEARQLVEAFEQACDMWQHREAEARTTARTALITALVGKDP